MKILRRDATAARFLISKMNVFKTTPDDKVLPNNSVISDKVDGNAHILVIESHQKLQLLNWRELREYQDLFLFLIWRQIRVRYAQSVLGIGWAIIQPLFSLVVFTIVFGKLAKFDSDGSPYALFSLAALLPWTYFTNAVNDGVASTVNEASMLRKIYFPRVLLPASAIIAKLLDFAIAALMMLLLMAWYRQPPSIGVFLLPLLILLMAATAAGVSIWLTALAVQYRDIKHAMTFLVQLAMYASPVVYPTSLIPEKYRLVYAVNPMVGIIEGFRSILLDTQPLPVAFISLGTLSSGVILGTGLLFFHRKDAVFADVA